MLFNRRTKPDFTERMRVALWPRRSWQRSIRYMLLRVQRLAAEPHAVALGFAFGVFASFLPFMGLHFLLAGLLAWAFRASILAAAFGTAIGNPLTFPLIWFAALRLGQWILGHESADAPSSELSTTFLQGSFYRIWPLIEPMTVGGTPLGLAAGAIGYVLVKRAVDAYQSNRLDRRARRAVEI